MTKQTKQTKQTKKENEKKTFLEYTKAGESIKTALNKTRILRRIFLNQNYIQSELAPAFNTLANKYGYSKKVYDMMASYPLKADLRKIATIRPFEDKKRDSLSPRMACGLLIAYFNRESNDSFNRVFPCGLFLENGILTDLMTGGFITAKAGEEEKQTFAFNFQKIGGLFKDKGTLALENKLAEADII